MQTIRSLRLLLRTAGRLDVQRNFCITPIACLPRSFNDRRQGRLDHVQYDVSEDTQNLVPDSKSTKNSVEIDYQYFRNVVSDLTSEKPEGLPAATETDKIRNLRPAIPAKTGNLATYVNESEVLMKLVELGVDMSKIEHDAKVCNHLLQIDFNTGIQPYLEFLLHHGVDKAHLGTLLTKNPLLLLEHLDDLRVRVNYLEVKKFSSDAISRILAKAPLFITQSTQQTDKKIGFLQKTFSLQGSEVRQVITAYPKLTTWPHGFITDVRFILREVCGFSNAEQKTMLLFQPKIYTSKKEELETKFDYLHNEMGLTHEYICQWPQVFRTRLFIIRDRHRFLSSIGRAQYDPKEPNFVTLKMLVSGKDAEFCRNVAKVPVQQYNNFLKSS